MDGNENREIGFLKQSIYFNKSETENVIQCGRRDCDNGCVFCEYEVANALTDSRTQQTHHTKSLSPHTIHDSLAQRKRIGDSHKRREKERKRDGTL